MKEARWVRSWRRHQLQAVVVTVALGAGVLAPMAVVGAPPAFAEPAAGPAHDGQPAPEKKRNDADPLTDAESRAFERAAETGEQVEVLEKRDEHTQHLANPDGTFTFKQFVRPAFAKVGGKWQEADAELRTTGGGRIAPAAATFGLSFSGGGDGPLATMDKGGKSLSIGWPTALPKPSIEGAEATYADVLPGVDLKIISETDGFAQHLVVKTAEAAKNPELAEISFTLKEHGLRLEADGDGNLSARDAKGEELFTAPTPAMWDSSHLPRAELNKLRSGSSSSKVEEEAPPAAVKMETEVSDNRLKITPKAELLAAPETVFPVVIDPVFSGGGRNNWTIAYKQSGNSSLAGTSYWNGGSFKDKLARVGHESDTGGTGRSYFTMDTKGLKGATVTSATFNAFNSSSWSCTKTPVELGHVGAISSATTWNKQPSWIETVQEKTFAHGWSSSSCPAKGEDFKNDKLKQLVQATANSDKPTLTLGLRSRASHETSSSSWKKFHNNPHLEVIYNHPPKLDSHAFYQGAYSPGGDGNQQVACSADPATWPTVGGSDLTLTAKVSDPDGGNIKAYFQVWEYAGPSHSDHRADVASGGTAQMKVDISKLEDGKRYKWHVRAEDGIVATDFSSQCGFDVDKKAPTKPVVTAADEHPLDVASVPARHDRKVTFTATDPAGIDGFCYTMNKPLAVANTKCANGTWAAADASGKATATVKPSLWPHNKLHVQAYDKAGNTSGYDGHDGEAATDTTLIVTKRPEYVHDERGRVHGDLPGDLDGDGHADLVATGKDGTLRVHQGKGDGGVSGSAAAATKEEGGWNGAKIAHRGDFTGANSDAKDGYEDFFVLIGQKLYLYPGDGNGMPLTERRKELIHPTGNQTGELKNAGKCVDLKSSDTDNGSTIQIHDCNQSAAQDFELSGGELRVMGKCVATTRGGALRSQVQLWDCNGKSEQQWLDRGDGSLVNPASGRCFDLPGNNHANGTAIKVYDCLGSAAQTWTVPGSWSGAHQILAPGNADGKTGNDLIVQEGPGMWLYSGTTAGHLETVTGTNTLKPGRQFGFSGWNQFDYIAPGDINGDGIPDLLGRHVTTDNAHAHHGTLYFYPGRHTTDTDGHTTYGISPKTAYSATDWDPGAVRDLASSGNVQGEVVDTGSYKKFVPAEGQETPDFWATVPGGDQNTGVLRFHPGGKERPGTPSVAHPSGWTESVYEIF